MEALFVEESLQQIAHGRVVDASRRRVVALTEELWDAGARAILLGCTEIVLATGAGPFEGLPTFDTTSLHAVGAGKCLDDPNSTTTSGTQLQIWDCSGQANQTWTRTSSGQLSLTVSGTTLCLDANAARNNRGGIGIDRVSTSQQRQLTKKRRARASAQRQLRKILRPGGVLDRVVMSFLPFPMNIRASVFAASRADGLCVACWIARRGIGRDDGGCVVSA